MGQDRWIPPLLLAASVVFVMAGAIWLLGYGRNQEDLPGAEQPRRRAPAEVTLWVGEAAPGLKGVLTTVFGDPGPDREHDGGLNRRLGLEGERGLAFYQLLVFNTTDETHTLRIEDGALTIHGPEGEVVPMRSLAAMVDRGEVAVGGGLAFVLESLGALERTIEIPPREMAKLVLPFASRVELGEASGVVTAEGRAFQRRRRTRAELRALIAEPTMDWIEDL